MNILCKLARFYVTQNMLILTVFVNVLLVTYSVIYGANFVTNFIAIINNDLHIVKSVDISDNKTDRAAKMTKYLT